jgi:hypothetical protein
MKNQSNTEVAVVSKSNKRGKMGNSPKWLDEYKNPLEMKSVAISNETLERMAEDLVKWAIETDAIVISKFFLYKGISWQSFYRWIAQCDYLGQAYELAKGIIGVRREEGAITGKLKDSMIMKIHGFYSPEWRQNEERLAQLNKDVNTPSNTPITVEIHASPITDVVPVLEKD